MTREEWDAMTPEEQWGHLKVIEGLLEAHESVTRTAPPCPLHGETCVPHARNWINEMRSLNEVR